MQSLPDTWSSRPRAALNRDKLVAETGYQFQVPFLRDPNTGVELFESEIIEYESVYTVDYVRLKHEDTVRVSIPNRGRAGPLAATHQAGSG